MPDEGYTLNLRTEAALKEVQDASFAAVNEALAATVEDARTLSPKRTGRNAASIQKRLRHVASGLKGTIFTESGYGGFLEAGTANMPAHPYIFPAAQLHFPNIAASVKLKLQK